MRSGLRIPLQNNAIPPSGGSCEAWICTTSKREKKPTYVSRRRAGLIGPQSAAAPKRN
jgi:hypothetical protein